MAKCNIAIDIKEPIEVLIEKAKQSITSVKGGTFVGTLDKGEYAIPTPVGKILGSYVVRGNSIYFEITDKPMFIGCERIEDELKKYLSSTSV